MASNGRDRNDERITSDRVVVHVRCVYHRCSTCIPFGKRQMAYFSHVFAPPVLVSQGNDKNAVAR